MKNYRILLLPLREEKEGSVTLYFLHWPFKTLKKKGRNSETSALNKKIRYRKFSLFLNLGLLHRNPFNKHFFIIVWNVLVNISLSRISLIIFKFIQFKLANSKLAVFMWFLYPTAFKIKYFFFRNHKFKFFPFHISLN